MYMYMYVCIYIYIHTYIRTYVRTYIHTYIHTYVHTYIHIHTPATAQPAGARALWPGHGPISLPRFSLTTPGLP